MESSAKAMHGVRELETIRDHYATFTATLNDSLYGFCGNTIT